MNALHMAFLVGVGFSALGAVVSLMRGEHRSYEGETRRVVAEGGSAR
jgi:hypothetical protein